MNYTKGEWVVRRYNLRYPKYEYWVYCEGVGLVAILETELINQEIINQEANANLIAAAPKLHKALRLASEYIADLKQAIRDICEDEGLSHYESAEPDTVITEINQALAQVEESK